MNKHTTAGITLAYPAKFTPHDDGEIVVSFRQFSHALTSGQDELDALTQARDCLAEAVAGLIAMGQPVPMPSPSKKGERLIPLDPVIAAKAMLSDAMRDKGVQLTDLAKRLSISPPTAGRLLDPHHESRMDSLMAALDKVGVTAAMTVVFPDESARSRTAPLRPIAARRGRSAA